MTADVSTWSFSHGDQTSETGHHPPLIKGGYAAAEPVSPSEKTSPIFLVYVELKG